MPSIEYDLAFLRAGIPELQGYLLSNEIYWPLGLATPQGERPYPRMTLGWLLLARTRAGGWGMTGNAPAQNGGLTALTHEMDEIRNRWRIAWEKKAAQEFSSRLKLWANYLNDYRGDKANHTTQYPYEVQRRVILHLLSYETDQLPPTELDLLKGMDGFLKAVLQAGGFVWEQDIASAFPPATFWYLYGTPTKQ